MLYLTRTMISSADLAHYGVSRAGAQIMLYLTRIMISSADLAHYGVSGVKNWVSVDCGTSSFV